MPREYLKMDKRSTILGQPVLTWVVFLIIAAYVLAWLDTPIFFDEAAFRRYSGRAFIDGFLRFNFFPQCLTPKAIPLLFMPASMVFSWMDSWPNWTGVRALPAASIAGLIVSAFLVIR